MKVGNHRGREDEPDKFAMLMETDREDERKTESINKTADSTQERLYSRLYSLRLNVTSRDSKSSISAIAKQ